MVFRVEDLSLNLNPGPRNFRKLEACFVRNSKSSLSVLPSILKSYSCLRIVSDRLRIVEGLKVVKLLVFLDFGLLRKKRCKKELTDS